MGVYIYDVDYDDVIDRLHGAENLVRSNGEIEPGYEGLAAITLGEIIEAVRRAEGGESDF